ncbi:zf-TFIIB domain-containing protein [Asticcacaulis sp.]|uniref:TFIIB-type zinc ribbon-containing protein n=1 Tax=Asticcacaulis sp. TaxID=1872648 RepID=UPI002BF205C0|nr:zf-TFIIB domain-containing protein [Asticcacaulis sp.]HTM83005.1 zf-TFIIB domain-containing protein [Asticcacaulis sp.]
MSALICPVCKGSFREVIREGILIDICTQCQGVWLDRGELEKLIALSKEDREIPLPPPSQPRAPAYRRDDDDHRYEGRDFAHGHKKKKKGFDFGDIFDFGD